MTYLRFHLRFNLPALRVVAWLARRRLAAVHWRCIAVLCGIVLLATTPWDNWAVYRHIWDFDWQRVHPVVVPLGGVVWRLPAEEYAFFLIETVFVSLLTILWLPARDPNLRKDWDKSHPG